MSWSAHGDPGGLAQIHLRSHSHSDRWFNPIASAHTLARLVSIAALFALEAALADPENMVREAAVAALAKWRSSFGHSD